MPSLITSCGSTPDWLARALSKVAQFDDLDNDDGDGLTSNVQPNSAAHDEVNKLYETIPSQVLNPSEWVKGGGKRPIAVNQGAKNRVNKAIHQITSKYQNYLPWNDILLAMAREGMVPVNADGSRFGQGMLIGDAECGTEAAREQMANLRITTKNAEGMWCMTNIMVHVSWCTMHGSGKYEVVCFVG
jgi:hypothetical protein